MFFFFNDTATTEIYTLSLHDALPIYNTLTSPCINISAQNITLDCNSYYIQSDDYETGIYSNQINTTIKDCNVSMADYNGTLGGFGIKLDKANNSYLYNNLLHNQFRGLNLLSTFYSVIDNNTFVDNYMGMRISKLWQESSYNNFSNINISTNGFGHVGIQASGFCERNRFENITISRIANKYSSDGLAYTCQNSTFKNFLISDTSRCITLYNDFDVTPLGTSNNMFYDSNLTNCTERTVYISGAFADSINNTFINISYSNMSKEYVDAGSELIRKWYLDVHVNDSNGNNISNANVSLYNISGDFYDSSLTDANGNTKRFIVIEYINNGTRIYWTNYTVNTTKSGYTTNSQQLNITTNTQLDILLILTSPSISITTPLNNTFSSNTGLDVNYTASDTNLDSCWYSNDTMSVNISLGTSCNNITSVTWTEGQHNVTVWANDSNGYENSSSVTFTIDTINPTWENNKTNLTASTPQGNLVYFNITLNDTTPGTYVFSWYNGTTWENNSATSYTNGQEVSVTKTININVGDINWTWYFNDSAGNNNQSDVWGVTLTADDVEYPIFSNYWDNNATLVGSGTALFNVTVTSTNGTVWLEINGVNYTATNVTASVYNTSVSLINDTYTYYWHSWGNGTNNYYNTSGARSYTVLSNESSLTIWDDSDSATVYANYSKFYANYTDSSGSPLNGSSYWCEFRHNKAGSWKDLINMSFNSTTSQYELIADGGYMVNNTEAHRDGMPIGTYSFNVSCYSTIGYNNQTLASGVTVASYTTSIVIENDTGKTTSEQVYFYANYTSTLMPVSGIGLNNYEIGQVIWDSGDIGSSVASVAFFDCENKGRKDCVAVGESGDLWLYYPNGSLLARATEPISTIYEIEVGDLDNDSYENDIVLADAGGYIWVFNESGDKIWNSSDLGASVYNIEIGDLDNDGLKDDFFVAYRVADGQNHSVGVWNTSDGNNWTLLWNSSYLSDISYSQLNEIKIGDIDRDCFEDDVVVVTEFQGGVWAFIGENGTLIFNTTDLGTVYTLAIIDLDHDGFRDEVVVGETSDIWVFEFNGTYNVTYTASDAILSNNIPIGSFGEIAAIDMDNDGWQDDFVVGDWGTINQGPGYIWAFDNDTTYLWNFTIPSSLADEDSIWSISIRDVNDDGDDEIIFSSENDDTIWVLNKSGSLLWNYELNLGNIGGNDFGDSPAIDTSDINNDGISDIAVASRNGYAHILQSVTCIAEFNDSTSYNMTWNNTLRKWEVNRTFSIAGSYDWNSTCSKGGYITQTASDTVSVALGNTDPSNSTAISLLSNDTLNVTTSDLNCSTTLDDDDLDKMNVTVRWYNNTVLDFSLDYNNSYANGTLFSAILNYANTTKTENWSCSLRIYDGTSYSSWLNSSNLTILNSLPTVTLVTPPDNNLTTDRTPDFNWTSTDADGDSLTYQINLTMIGASTCSDAERTDSGLTDSNYTPTPYLRCLSDNNDYYNWTVRASDDGGSTYGNWTTPWRINVSSVVIISLPTNFTSFGSMLPDVSDNTTDGSPTPFLLQNDGNCMANITMNATDLWTSISGNSSYFQFKVDNNTLENGSFNWLFSQTSWEQVPNTTQMTIVEINWSDATDSAEIDLLVTIPLDEPPGNKTSTITFTSSLAE